MSQSLGSLTHSVTSGLAKAQAVPSGTGLQRGATGSAVKPMAGVMVPDDPVETNRNLAESLPPQIANWLASDGHTGALETRWQMYGEPDRLTLEAAYSASLAAMQPATEAQLTKALATLRAVTKSRETPDDDTDLANAVMVRELQRFPADAALAAIRHLARESTFFPALAELIEAAHQRCARRLPLHRLLTKRLT